LDEDQTHKIRPDFRALLSDCNRIAIASIISPMNEETIKVIDGTDDKEFPILIGGKKPVWWKGEFNPENPEHVAKLAEKTRLHIGTFLRLPNVAFLLGAGCSMDAGGISLAKIPSSIKAQLQGNARTLFDKVLQTLIGYDPTMKQEEDIDFNLETLLSRLYIWQNSMEGDKITKIALKDGADTLLEVSLDDLKELIWQLKAALLSSCNLPQEAERKEIKTHCEMLFKVLTRPVHLRRVNLFTLNYDTLIEQAADYIGANLIDGFVGTIERTFRPESYDQDFYYPGQTTEGRVHRLEKVLHLYKLHGSINWRRGKQDMGNPYGLYATQKPSESGKEDEVIIYPTPLKYGEVLGLPYSELFRRFASAIVQPQSVLFVIGYGFGDEHVNTIIKQALAIPSFFLVIVDPKAHKKFKTLAQKYYHQEDHQWGQIWSIAQTFKEFVGNLLPDIAEEEHLIRMRGIEKRIAQEDGEGTLPDQASEASEENDGK